VTYVHFNCQNGFSPGAALAALIGAGADVGLINSRLTALKLVPGQLRSFIGRADRGLLYTGLNLQPTTNEAYPAVGLTEAVRARGVEFRAANRFAQVMELLLEYYSVWMTKPVYLSDKQLVELLGTVLALELLHVDQLYVSPLPLGSGSGQTGELGNVLAMLTGFMVCSGAGSTVINPAGAALIKALALPDRQMPEFVLRATGWGGELEDGVQQRDGLAGTSFKALVNVALGQPVSGGEPVRNSCEEVLCMETAIDDMNPEFYPYLVTRLLEAGALDAYLQPIIMKKGRPGVLLAVLARPEQREALQQLIFSETTTLGVRWRIEQRTCLPRELLTVPTEYGPVQVKLALDDSSGQPSRYAPEFEDCLARARERHVPLQNVYRAALLAAVQMGNKINKN